MGGAWENPELRPIGASRHIFCRIGKEEFGIPLIVKLLQEHGFRGTFFVETLATRCLGEGDTKSVFDFLLREDQDVQLHIHPNFRFYAESQKARQEGRNYHVPRPNDLLGHFPKQVQLDLLGEAIQYFQRFSSYRPRAFRAGCYASSRTTMQCLAELGIAVDSSLNLCYPALSFPGESQLPNRVRKIEGVWEIPVTVARTPLREGYNGFKFADCTSLAPAELRAMLDAAAAAKQEHFVIVFHSFSAVKAKNSTYAEMRPNRIVIRRLEQLFQYLADNRDRFNVSTMGEAANSLAVLESSSHSTVADLSLLRAAVRKGVQFVNDAYWT